MQGGFEVSVEDGIELTGEGCLDAVFTQGGAANDQFRPAERARRGARQSLPDFPWDGRGKDASWRIDAAACAKVSGHVHTTFAHAAATWGRKSATS